MAYIGIHRYGLGENGRKGEHEKVWDVTMHALDIQPSYINWFMMERNGGHTLQQIQMMGAGMHEMILGVESKKKCCHIKKSSDPRGYGTLSLSSHNGHHIRCVKILMLTLLLEKCGCCIIEQIVWSLTSERFYNHGSHGIFQVGLVLITGRKHALSESFICSISSTWPHICSPYRKCPSNHHLNTREAP